MRKKYKHKEVADRSVNDNEINSKQLIAMKLSLRYLSEFLQTPIHSIIRILYDLEGYRLITFDISEKGTMINITPQGSDLLSYIPHTANTANSHTLRRLNEPCHSLLHLINSDQTTNLGSIHWD